MSTLDLFSTILLFAGLAILALGWFRREPRWRAAGWLAFGLAWPPHAAFYVANGDPLNTAASLVAPVPAAYVAWLEWRGGTNRAHSAGRGPEALRWLAGVTAFGGGAYVLFTSFEPLVEWLSAWTADQSAWMTQFAFGVDTYAYRPEAPSPQYGFRASRLCLADGFGNGGPSVLCGGAAAVAGYPYYAYTIILACTSLHIMLVFAAGVVLADRVPWRHRLAAVAVGVPAIHLMNLYRNAGIVYGFRVQAYTAFGLDAWTFVHSVVSKAGALGGVVVVYGLAIWALPGLRATVWDLIGRFRGSAA